MDYETITHLEMTSPSELVPGRRPPAHLEMQKVGAAAAPVIRATYVRIGAPHGWTGRSDWSDAQWEEELSRPGIHAWIARVDEDVAGFVELEAESSGDVGIVVLGLVPELVGRGFGGALLTLATELAWELTSRAERPRDACSSRPLQATTRTPSQTTNAAASDRSAGSVGRRRPWRKTKRSWA
jgi:GNAT superfamily N-acetyltransferase